MTSSPDGRLRSLERIWKEEGSIEAETAYRTAQLRAGEISSVKGVSNDVKGQLLLSYPELLLDPDFLKLEYAYYEDLREKYSEEDLWLYLAQDRVPIAFRSPDTDVPEEHAIHIRALRFLDMDIFDFERTSLRRMRNLRLLDISGSRAINGEQLEKLLDDLEYTGELQLKLGKCDNILISNDSAIALKGRVCFLLDALKYFSHLRPEITELIKIKRVSLDRISARITDKKLEAIARLRGLRYLYLDGCQQITDKGLEAVSRLSGLTALTLNVCQQITDKGLEEISSLSELRLLDLSECPEITIRGLKHLKKLPNLTDLYLDGCDGITDEEIRFISTLKGLSSLGLSRIIITDDDLELLSGLHNLTSIGLDACSGMTRAGLKRFKDHLPNCNINGKGLIQFEDDEED